MRKNGGPVQDHEPGHWLCYNCGEELRWNVGVWWHETGNMQCYPDEWLGGDIVSEPVPAILKLMEDALYAR